MPIRQAGKVFTSYVVTDTDKRCEEEIVKILRSATPDFGIIAEEGTNFPGEKIWMDVFHPCTS